MTTWYERRMRSRGGYHIGRRQLLLGALGVSCAPVRAPSGDVTRMQLGAQVGDVTSRTAVIWSATDQIARMRVHVNGRTFDGSVANAESDFTAKTLITGLSPGTRVSYRAALR